MEKIVELLERLEKLHSVELRELHGRYEKFILEENVDTVIDLQYQQEWNELAEKHSSELKMIKSLID
jgi:hypothetical protein